VNSPPRRAFTLIEVLIAGSIFLIIFAAASQVFFMTRVAYSQQRDVMTAENIIQEQLERLIVLAPQHPDLTGGAHPPLPFDRDGIRIRNASPARFSMGWEVALNTPLKSTKRLTVSVKWLGQRGEPHEMSFVTDRD
jgi:prepilin-type N-terminal cleavage/methylation domain-containing protein